MFTLENDNYKIWKIIFVTAAIWNLLGATLGTVFTFDVFMILFDRSLSDPLVISIYRGAWGSSFLYFLGYLFVAYNPQKQTGVIIIGTIGKIFFAFTLFTHYLNGLATSYALIVIVGDVIFSILFIIFLYVLWKNDKKIF